MLSISHLKSFSNDNAQEVSKLFSLVYDNDYVYPEVYQAETFCKHHANGTWESVLAISTDGHVIGHGALVTHPHCPQIPEIGMFVVHPEARNLGLATKISQELIEKAKTNGVTGVGTKQVCNHPFSQKLAHSLGFLNLGFWPNYIASPFDAGQTRESILCAYLPLRTEPKKILYLTEELCPNARALTKGVDKIGEIASAQPGKIPAHTAIETNEHEPEVIELYLHQWGKDGGKKIETLDQNQLTFVLVNAELPENSLATSHLLEHGFSFMGLIPDQFSSWTWLFAKNFDLEAARNVIDERVKDLIICAEARLDAHKLATVQQ